MILGSHVSFSSKQLLGSAKEAVSYGANAFMFYTGAPQNTMRKEIDKDLLEQAKKYMNDNGLSLSNVICHAPYIINLANKKDPVKWNFSISFLKQELSRCDELGVSFIVIHPGSAVGLSKNEALENISEALNLILENPYSCKILLETMAGKGTECGSNLEEIKFLYEKTNKRVGVCLDTCHLHDSGVSLKEFDSYLEAFDKEIGLKEIGCIHVNDSKNVLGSHKDRHANIGYGTIGFDVLLSILYHEKLKHVVKILETPYVGEHIDAKEKIYPPYRFEILMIKEKVFDENLLSHIVNYYKNSK